MPFTISDFSLITPDRLPDILAGVLRLRQAIECDSGLEARHQRDALVRSMGCLEGGANAAIAADVPPVTRLAIRLLFDELKNGGLARWLAACKEFLDAAEPSGKKPMKRDGARRGRTVNERMRDKAAKAPESVGWSARKWAAALSCSESTVADTACWKEWQPLKEGHRLAKKMRK